MKRLLILIMLAGFLAGCMGQLPSVCDNQTESVLCDVAERYNVRLETVGDILMVVNLRAIKEGVYTKSQARGALLSMKEAYHAANFTATDLKALILEYVDEYPELILVVQYVGYFDMPDVLRVKDVEFLDSYIDQQLTLIQ